MSARHDDRRSSSALSRRELLAAGTALAALSAGTGVSAAPKPKGRRGAKSPQAPFDTLRDYMQALDDHGLLLRIPEIDQDAFHATALFYRATDEFGMFGAPAFLFGKLKIDGRWVDGPVVANHQGNLHTDAIVFGVEPVPGDGRESYRQAKAKLAQVLKDNGGRYPQIPPVQIQAKDALCKQVVLKGDDIDLTRFAFIETNPADAGRYVNTASVFMHDPEMGGNFGTYRCQLRGPRLLGLNPEPGQTGWRMLTRARERGDKLARVSLVLGQDPVMWFISGTRVAGRMPGSPPIDELALAGGFRGRAMDVVKSETSDMLVPAHAEMVIEGEVPLQEAGLPEGPFGEMFGYLGPAKAENFWINVTAVTHRRDPWLMNAFTGMQRGMVTSPQDALYEFMLRRAVPNLVEMYQPQDTMGVAIMAIDKTEPGQAMKAGRLVAQRNPIAKVIIVVDKDIDVMDRTQVMFALGSRWQPHPASEIIRDIGGILTDPSQPEQGKTSKIIIDATRQWPAEGGRAEFPETNRALLEEGAPGAMAEAERLYGSLLRDWERSRI